MVLVGNRAGHDRRAALRCSAKRCLALELAHGKKALPGSVLEQIGR